MSSETEMTPSNKLHIINDGPKSSTGTIINRERPGWPAY